MRGYVFTGDKEVALIEKDTPEPGPGQVLLKEKTSTICGSDLHYYRASKESRAASADIFTGHEPVGVVVTVGPGVEWPKVGDRVIGYHVEGCGTCEYCMTRRFKLCPHNFSSDPDDPLRIAMQENRDGSNADFFLATVGQLLPLPDDFSYEEGSVLACNFGTAWGALKNGVTFAGGTVVVWGLGPVGLNTVLIAKAMGLRVIGIDLSEARQEIARELGAEIIDGHDPDPVATIRSVTGDAGADTVIDTTGVGAVHQLLVSATRRGGHVVLVGLGNQTSVGPAPQAILRQVTIHGSWIYDIEDWGPMLAFVRRHNLDVMSTVDKVVPIAEFAERMKEADAATAGKIVFVWDD